MHDDGWIPVEERLPEEGKPVLIQMDVYDKYLCSPFAYMDVVWLNNEDDKTFTPVSIIPTGKVVAWRPLPESYGNCFEPIV